MSSHVKLRKDRVGVVIYDTQIKGTLQWWASGRGACFRNKSPFKIGLSVTSHHVWLVFLCFVFTFVFCVPLFRGPQPASGPAEGSRPATGAQEPADAGPEWIPSAAGGDRGRLRPLTGKTRRKVHVQDQEVSLWPHVRMVCNKLLLQKPTSHLILALLPATVPPCRCKCNERQCAQLTLRLKCMRRTAKRSQDSLSPRRRLATLQKGVKNVKLWST